MSTFLGRLRLSSAIKDANAIAQRVMSITESVNNRISLLSYSQKREIESLAKQFLLKSKVVMDLIEKDQSLMTVRVPGFYGPVVAMFWMQWSMQWFSEVERILNK